ncbi:MAG TPA: lasso peptide isopeptide bond-forming cyclase [Crinalium sp.]
MSGITGIYHLDGQTVDRADVQRMTDAIAHRGPDGSNLWIQDSVGLGHCLLWTTPESLLEAQPESSSDSSIFITADARIDNRDELIPVLELGDRPSEKITDSQVILAAYQKWGTSCSEYLLGDFTFVIWDTRIQSLFCSRDHFGVKPFYYCQIEQQFLFASEIKALLSVPQVPCQLNEVRIADYLALMLEDKSITTYRDIWRLPPAHSMIVSASGIDRWPYWSLNPGTELHLESDEAYAEAFRQIFTEAVRCRLRTALPLGSQLSGGLDSSAVTCVARNLLKQEDRLPLHTFSSIFDTVTECDERPFINTVLEQGDIIPHYVHADQVGPLSDLEQIWNYEDESFTGPSHFLVWGLHRVAQQAGMRVLLGGFDGDSTVCHGITRLKELAQQGDWKTFRDEAEGVSQHFDTPIQVLLQGYGLPQLADLAKQWRWRELAIAIQQIHRYFGLSRKRLWLRYGLRSVRPKVFKRRSNVSQPKNLFTHDSTSLINSNFAQRTNLEKRIQELNHLPESSLTVKEFHWRTLTSGVFAFTLEQVDRYAAACSLEVRHPFMDKRLIEFCLSLPSDQKLRQGWSRMIMRRALANILPETIQWRGGKANLTPNFLHGLLNLDRNLLDDVIFNRLDTVHQYINPDVAQTAYHRITSTDNPSESDVAIVWRAVVLTLWLGHSQVTP